VKKSETNPTVYHGSNHEFDKFDTKHQKSGFYPGIYSTPNKDRAAEHGKYIHEAKLKGKYMEFTHPSHGEELAREHGVPHTGSGKPLADKLASIGYAGIKRGSEYITFHHDNIEKVSQPKMEKSESHSGIAGMPEHIVKETIALNHDLKATHGKAVSLSGHHLTNYLEDNPGLMDTVKEKHSARLQHHFGHSPEALAHAHEHGITATYKKIKEAKQNERFFRRRWTFPDDDTELQKANAPAIPKHNENIRAVADSYAAKKGFKLDHNAPAPKVDPANATKIANEYQNMKHDPEHPAVKSAYKALTGEVMDQYNHIKGAGLKTTKIKPGQDNPYKTSKDLHADLRDNNHMWYFPTETGFGSGNAVANHPMLGDTGHKDNEGKPLLANDAFRIVHDYFGHGKEGSGFGSGGEEAAWASHKQMFSPEAQKALTTETRGQNSWVNFSDKVGVHNRANPSQTIYAEQKAGLMPDWTNHAAPASAPPKTTKGKL